MDSQECNAVSCNSSSCSSSSLCSSLDSLLSGFNRRIAELQELIPCRNVDPCSSATDFMAVETTVAGMEQSILSLKTHLKEEFQALPKAQELINRSLIQQRKLDHMLQNFPTSLLAAKPSPDYTSSVSCSSAEPFSIDACKIAEDPKPPKERKSRASPPRWYLTNAELDSLSSYMRGRLTLDKVNAAVDEMAQHADDTAHLLGAPRNKLGEDLLKKALELRDIAMCEAVKGKHFFLEADLKGPILKLDNTGKAILTVLRHLGRVSETRIGRHRVLILVRPQ